MTIVVQNLLHLIHQDQMGGPRLKLPSPDKAVADFVAHLDWVIASTIHNPGYRLEYLIPQCFRRSGVFRREIEVNNYARANLVVARDMFVAFIERVRGNKRALSARDLAHHAERIHTYIADLKSIVEHLHRKKDPEYIFYVGWKFPALTSFEMHQFADSLARYPTGGTQFIYLNGRVSSTASVFTLRQALEAKFRRIVGVHLVGRDGRPPKLRHEFYLDFIRAHPDLFRSKMAGFDMLHVVFRWCNDVVHGAAQPVVWQVDLAIHFCAGLLCGYEQEAGGFNFNNAIELADADAMQQCFLRYFSDRCRRTDTAVWCVVLNRPEVEIIPAQVASPE